MVFHPGREGVDPGAEFQALGLDGTDQVASPGLDAGILSVDPGALSVDPVALSVDPVALSVDPGAQTRSEGIDPGPKIEETAERSEDRSTEQPDRGPRHRLHRSLTVAPATDTQAGEVQLPAGPYGSP